MVHLRSITLSESEATRPDTFPFNVPVIRTLTRLEFASPVTFFVGENGSGKSALLETLACAIGSISAGSESVKTDKTLVPARELARHFRLTWTKRTHKGLFLRAEDFFGYVQHLAQTKAELTQDLANLDEEYKTRSEDAQFIIATHSPIILAYPGATIFSFDRAPIEPATYDELEHVWLTRSFLDNRERWLNELLKTDGE
jgi:predicted ATPase